MRSWLASTSPVPVWVRFDHLVAAPEATVRAAVTAAAPELRPVEDAALPEFAELHAHDPGFFRSGATGAYRTELPPDLHDLFWRQSDNAAAMRAFGFGDPP